MISPRLEEPPKAMLDISWKTQVRLAKRFRRLMARRKNAHQVGAMARELVGCRWAMAKQVPRMIADSGP
jgi:hypothetical protein